MTAHLNIDFVSDIACPWCAVGLFSLNEALRRTKSVVSAKLTFRPFELNPDMPSPGVNHHEHIADKFGMTVDQLSSSGGMLRERASSVGFTINSNADSRIYNTFDAHRLLHWAASTGKQQDLKQALFKANFTDNRNVSDPEELVTIATSVGLDGSAARDVLASDRYAAEVRAEEKMWMSRGIHAVPGIVINGKWLISGGQPPEYFEQALRTIAGELAAEPGSGTK